MAITLNDRKSFMIKPLLMGQVMHLEKYQIRKNALKCAWRMKNAMPLNTQRLGLEETSACVFNYTMLS